MVINTYAAGGALRLAMMASMIFLPISGFSTSAFWAASLPWPIRFAIELQPSAFFIDDTVAMPTSRMLPSLLMP